MAAEKAGKNSRFAELGPAWITAIGTFLAALVAAAGFFVVRAAAPPTSRPAHATSTTGPISDTSAPGTRASTPTSQPSAGMTLSQFMIDLPEGYGLTFGASTPRPVSMESSTDLYLTWSNGFYTADHPGTLVTVDTSTPTYTDCITSTRFTATVIFPKAGTGFCYEGHNLVASLSIAKVLDQYDTLAVTVWQAPSMLNGK